jgi:hypothetical protein
MLGRVRGEACHEEGCRSGRLPACWGGSGERHAMKRTVVVEDGRHAVGEACHEEGCSSGEWQACCRRGMP